MSKMLSPTSISIVTDVDLLAREWKLRENITAYDAMYVGLAESLDAPTSPAKAGSPKRQGTGAHRLSTVQKAGSSGACEDAARSLDFRVSGPPSGGRPIRNRHRPRKS